MLQTMQNQLGTIRARKPQATLEVISPLLKQAGVTRLADLTRLDCLDIPVYTAIRPMGKNLATSQGKGINRELAKCSAYMEAIEHYFAENAQPDLSADLSELDPKTTLSPEQLTRGLIKNNHELKIKHWSCFRNLINAEKHLAPTALINFDLSQPVITSNLFKKTTTGLASGNNETEALCHAAFELIERNAQTEFDAKTLKERNQLIVANKSIDFAPALELIEKCKQQQVELIIFDMSNKFAVPSYYAVMLDRHPLRKLPIFSGSGSHLHNGIALCRAITEAAQSRLTYIAGSRDDLFPCDYKRSWQTVNYPSGLVNFAKRNVSFDLSLKAQLEWIIDKFTQLECPLLAYNHTPKNMDIAVVKVVGIGCC